MTYFAAKPGMKIGDKFYVNKSSWNTPAGWWEIYEIYDDGDTEVSASPCVPPDNEAILLMQGTEYVSAQ